MLPEAASASPGLSVVANVIVAPSCSIERTRPDSVVRHATSTMSRAGHSSTGAAKYQTANAGGSHARAFRTNLATGPVIANASRGGAAGAVTPEPSPRRRPGLRDP